MTDSTWTNENDLMLNKPPQRIWQIVAVVVVLVATISFVLYNALQSGGTQLYLTVNEYMADEARLATRDVRVSGWVVGETIEYTQISADQSRLEFDIVDDLQNPTRRLHIVAYNEPKPDLLQNQAQALVEGRAGEPGTFVANKDGLLLKCPTRYEGEETILNEG